jgi:hypothetical protein
MKYRIAGYREGDFLFLNHPKYRFLWEEIDDAVTSVTDDMIADEFTTEARQAKSISQAINRLLKTEFLKRDWQSESYIFADEKYARNAKGTWRLDFAKDRLSVEVAFNHRSDISWNMIKPTLASELNHVDKAIQTDGGVIITATEEMKKTGGFDSACGTFEDCVQYLRPMGMVLTAPLVIVGLEALQTLEIVHFSEGNKKVGQVLRT